MGIIKLLPEQVANQIAAGEVVQRPASVVKELLENAVDAKATDITLAIKEAGKALIQVIDNGFGMNPEDARLCFLRHSTSKIKQAEDLFTILTKGFRGEALASIAAVAHVELKTRETLQELGTHVVVEGGNFVSQEAAICPKGTNFVVKNLFYNIPARRNFLRSDTSEFRIIVDEFQRVALPHPKIAFSFLHNGTEMVKLPPSTLRQRIVNIFGGKTNDKLIPIKEETTVVNIEGFVCKPEYAKKTRGEQFFFVNNRYIKSGYLHHAVQSAFEGLLQDGKQASYYIYLTVPPHTIDINIHPTKTEIKFDDDQLMYNILRSCIKHSLGQFNVVSVLDFNRDPNLDTPYSYKDQKGADPNISFDDGFNPFERETVHGNMKYKPATASWESLFTDLKQEVDVMEAEDMQFESQTVASSLFDLSEVEETKYQTYQIHRKYIFTPIKSGIVIVNQQYAHERVLYEQFLRNMTLVQASSQKLLFPLKLSFNPNEIDMLSELHLSLINTGFIFDEIKKDYIVLSGIPPNMTDTAVNNVLEQILSDLYEGIPADSFSQNDTIAKSMCRTLAIKTGSILSEKEQEGLVNSLFACKEPEISPFLKPTFITMRVEDLDKKFN